MTGEVVARTAAAVLAAALLAGCRGVGAGAGVEAGGAATAASPAPAPSPSPAGRLLVGLGAERSSGEPATTFAPGQPVTLVLVVLNRSTGPARLVFPSGKSYDFWIARDGREVWRWSAGRMFTQAIREQEVAPGERLEFRESWARVDAAGQPVPPGNYEAHGLLAVGDSGLPAPPLAITLEP